MAYILNSPTSALLIKLIIMPYPPQRAPKSQKRQSFRQRYDELEMRRSELAARLHLLGATAERHPAYRRALKLLNDIYRREKLPQRLAVLQAAAWLIDVLEKLVGTL